MRTVLARIFGGGSRQDGDEPAPQCQELPELVDSDVNRRELVKTDVYWAATSWPFPTRSWAEPAEHAAAILEFLQGPGGRTGSLPVEELQQLHLEICAEKDWEPIGWTAVGRELRKLLKAEKTYELIHGRRIRVYRIRPLAVRACVRAV